MKIRSGFISNSSSSSFVLNKSTLTDEQIHAVLAYPAYADKNGLDWWQISDGQDTIRLTTPCDNCEIYPYLEMFDIKVR